MHLRDRAAVLKESLGEGVVLALDAIILSFPHRDIERPGTRLLTNGSALLHDGANVSGSVNRGALPVGDVNQFVEKNLVGPVHARVALIFTEVFVLALQCVVVFDTLSLSLDCFLECLMPLDFLQFFLMIVIACCTILQDIGVILNVSRGLHL